MVGEAARTIEGGESVADRLKLYVGSASSASRGMLTARPYRASPETTRNLADAVHYFCLLHGRSPGVMDLAAHHVAVPSPLARNWLTQAADGFTRERHFLARLTAAAGPQPSLPGQAACDAAVLGQRQAAETLAKSERQGCAIGAAIALALDWRSVREVLDIAAVRFGVEAPRLGLPNDAETYALADSVAVSPASSRALLFGADQIMTQHRNLWTLLETRRSIR